MTRHVWAVCIAAALAFAPAKARAVQVAPALLASVAAADSLALPSGEAAPRAATAPAARAASKRRAAPARLAMAAGANVAPALPLRASSSAGVLHVQSLLSAARYSPGVLDGRYRRSTRRAVRAFRIADRLGAGETVDDATYARLREAAGAHVPVLDYTLTPADVRGPFRPIPKSPYDRVKLECLCYTSAIERLGEKFYTTPEMLRQLNPGVPFDSLAASMVLHVPNVQRVAPLDRPVRLIVDKASGTLRGLDVLGATLFVFPASVGSAETPSPKGVLRVRSVSPNPWYKYNPGVLARGQESGRTADIPPGPNSPVGVIWIQLSKAHVGIHGTPDPELVGATESHGCVRLTNWDARYLGGLLDPGTEVEFR